MAGQKPGCIEEGEQMQEADYNFPLVRSRTTMSSAKKKIIVDSQYILIIVNNAAIVK